VNRLIEIHGDLDGQDAAFPEQTHEFPNQFFMIRHPLDACIGKYDVEIVIQR
jgi:hypothetical protein